MKETNYEHYKDQIIKISACGDVSATRKDANSPIELGRCSTTECRACLFNPNNYYDDNCNRYRANCALDKLDWFEQEYQEKDGVDWSKVPIDTPIYVRNSELDDWTPRYFAGCSCGTVLAYRNGVSSFTSIAKGASPWNYAKLANVEVES